MNLPVNTRERLRSLDVFRGITVLGMILVNNPGSWSYIYPPLAHATWNGCTPADLVFPFFLFIVGVSICISLGNKVSHQGHARLLWAVARRATILFALGLFLAAFPSIFTNPVATIQQLRIPGILQRIAIVFFIAAVIFIKTKPRTQAMIAIGLLIVYWLLMTCVPVPGLGYANLEKETNLGAWLDRTLLGESHLWKLSVSWDPEGILGTLPAIATALLGVLTGHWLKRNDWQESTKVAWMFTAGCLITLLGLLWNFVFPINKALWTSSYMLYTGGLAMVGFALCYWLVDVQGYKKWTKPFVVYGVNALAAFFLSTLGAKLLNLPLVGHSSGEPLSTKAWLYQTLFEPYFPPLDASLAMALVYVLVWLLILWVMYAKKIFIKI